MVQKTKAFFCLIKRIAAFCLFISFFRLPHMYFTTCMPARQSAGMRKQAELRRKLRLFIQAPSASRDSLLFMQQKRNQDVQKLLDIGWLHQSVSNQLDQVFGIDFSRMLDGRADVPLNTGQQALQRHTGAWARNTGASHPPLPAAPLSL